MRSSIFRSYVNNSEHFMDQQRSRKTSNNTQSLNRILASILTYNILAAILTYNILASILT